MNDENEPKWPPVVFFSVCGLFLLSCVWYIWTGTKNPEYQWQKTPEKTSQAKLLPPTVGKRILLTKNRGRQIGSDRIVYRGSDDGSLLLELYILQLDPQYGYPHRVDTRRAREGFRMGDHLFQLLAASDGKISLKLL